MRKKAIPLILLALIILAYQACGNRLDFNGVVENLISTPDKNGEPYSGKPTIYDFSNQQKVCLEKGANGNALPNSQIFMFPNGLAELVRENCVDIPPKPLSAQDYSIAGNGDLIYQNQIFTTLLNPDPFAVVAAACPAGRTLLAHPVRTSFMQEPLDLQASVWEHPALSVNLVGSLGSLPLYKVQRNDPNALENWHRMAQSPILVAGETYVYSFYVKPDPSEKLIFVSYYPNIQDVEIEFDLVTGAATIQNSMGASQISTQAQMFSGGLYINIYFQSLSSTSANIGIASVGQFLGSSVSATALQFEKVSNFCSP